MSHNLRFPKIHKILHFPLIFSCPAFFSHWQCGGVPCAFLTDDACEVGSSTSLSIARVRPAMAQTLHRRNLSNESHESVDLHISAATTPKKQYESRKPTASMMTNGSAPHAQQQQQQDDDVESRQLLNSASFLVERGINTTSTEKENGSVNSPTLSPSGWKALVSCANYSFCSVSMILVNKSLASRCVY